MVNSLHFVRHNIELATACLEDYGPFSVVRYQISICCYIAIVHFCRFDDFFLSNKNINFCSVLCIQRRQIYTVTCREACGW